MVLLLLEALLALVILVAIVWWTMFSGRQKGELRRQAQAEAEADDAQQHAQGSDTPTGPTDKR